MSDPCKLSIVCIIFMLPASIGYADEPIDFRNDLVPVLTKNGCNAGACHGAAIGRGGFKLSLYGGDPTADYEAIVRQAEGRRVNLARPEESLIVLKPAEQLEHDGGNVFDLDSDSARRLIDWIRQGAKHDSQRELRRVEITPQRNVAQGAAEPVQLHAVATFTDGSTRDVTDWTIFTAEDSSAVDVDAENATATVLRQGRHIIVARYQSEVVPIELIVPRTDAGIDLTAEPRANFTDEEIFDSLVTLGVPPSPLANDATFLRRVTLDLTGRLPAIETVRAVQHHGLNRSELVDDLLASDDFTEYWTLQLAKLLRIRPRNNDAKAMSVYHAWLTEQIRNDVSYKEFARTLLTALGDTHELGPANFFRTTKDAREQAEFVSELFMGSRLRCANCHNHPLDRWTQDDYHGLAAIFATVDADQVVTEKPSGLTIHPRTLEPASARIPGERFLESVDARQQLADWLTDSKNPYFAKAIVNRLWKHMMGRGLVEPVDDFRATNPATHPELLKKLADDFVANGYRLRHTLQIIAGSAAYARSSNATHENKHDDQFYSHAARRPLEPEVLADAISDVLGVAETYGEQPAGTRAIALDDPTIPSLALDILGRCGRQESCEASSGAVGGLPQKLHLFNGELLNARISADESRLSRLLAAGKRPMEIVIEFYCFALNRQPSEREQQHWRTQLHTIASDTERKAFLEDFVWGLMTCDEFVTNH